MPPKQGVMAVMMQVLVQQQQVNAALLQRAGAAPVGANAAPGLGFAGLNQPVNLNAGGMPNQVLQLAGCFQGETSKVMTIETVPAVVAAQGIAAEPEFKTIIFNPTIVNLINRLITREIWRNVNGTKAQINLVAELLVDVPLLNLPGTTDFARGFEEEPVRIVAALIIVAINEFQGTPNDGSYIYKRDTSRITAYLGNPRNPVQKRMYASCRALSTFLYTVSMTILAGHLAIRRNVFAAGEPGPNTLGNDVRRLFKSIFAIGLAVLDDTADLLNVIMTEGFIATTRKALVNNRGITATSTTTEDNANRDNAIPDDARAQSILDKSDILLAQWFAAQDLPVSEDASPAPKVQQVTFSVPNSVSPAPISVSPVPNYVPPAPQGQQNQGHRSISATPAPSVAGQSRGGTTPQVQNVGPHNLRNRKWAQAKKDKKAMIAAGGLLPTPVPAAAVRAGKKRN